MTRWIDENAFFVLELPVDCSAMDIERQGQKLLAMLELDLQSAGVYRTPRGERPRTQESIRHAMAELREPRKRIVHELWARRPPDAPPPAGVDEQLVQAWPEAFVAMGWLRS